MGVIIASSLNTMLEPYEGGTLKVWGDPSQVVTERGIRNEKSHCDLLENPLTKHEAGMATC